MMINDNKIQLAILYIYISVFDLPTYITCIIQIYSRITSGRVFDLELLYTEVLEVNLFVFAYRLFHADFCIYHMQISLN